tara:strand:- start:959 stop:1090 length:132 start_codon:yes stop_codon:yes gene_type:complete
MNKSKCCQQPPTVTLEWIVGADVGSSMLSGNIYKLTATEFENN